jgi:hypothetical protein
MPRGHYVAEAARVIAFGTKRHFCGGPATRPLLLGPALLTFRSTASPCWSPPATSPHTAAPRVGRIGIHRHPRLPNISQ